MGLEEAGGRVGLVGWLAGWVVVVGGVLLYRFTGKRWPSVFANATGRNVFRGTAGATGGKEKGKKAGEGRKQNKTKQRVCWPHVTVCTFPACSWLDVMLNVQAEG